MTSILLRLVFVLLCAVPAAHAAPLTVEAVFGVPSYAETQLSENGRYLAVLTPVKGRVNLSVIDLETRKSLARVEIPGADIRSIRWLGNERLVFSMEQIGRAVVHRFNTGGLFMVSRDGKEQRKLFPTAQEWFKVRAHRFVYYSVAGLIPGQGDEVVVTANDIDEHSFDVYRLNVTNGKRTLLSPKRPPRVHGWLLDANQVPRVALSSHENSTDRTTWYRASEDAPWKALWRASTTSGAMAVALHLEADGRHLLVASNEGRDTMALYRYDAHTGERKELLAEHPRFDLGATASGDPTGDLVWDAAGRDVLGVRIDIGEPTTLWLDEGHQRLQALIDGALPGLRNVFARSLDGTRTLVSSYSDRQPTRWHLLDEKTGQMEALFVSRPWLDNGALVAMKPVFYTTRDGLEMLAYVFEPTGRKPGERVPAVVLIHGGPWTESVPWGPASREFQEAQLLASRGYAVIAPNFRGTTGLGKRIYQSARGQFGLAMQDDIEDATDWLVAQGIADAQRICLSGASYGGYAALMGLVKTPAKYRCAVSGLPVTDLAVLMSSGWSSISKHEASRLYWTEMVGDPATQTAQLNAVSPARQAHRIQGRVMLYGSVDDTRTPIEQMELMRSALRAQGQEPRWMAKYGEGHGFSGSENLLELYQQKFDFLAQSLSREAARPDGPAR